jgi:hypothetical protein
MATKPQSLKRSAAKHIARTAAHRLISDKVGSTTLVGSLAKTLISFGIRKLDKKI